MQLTADQQDSLTELINIAFSRTAASLSDLTGDRVELTPPEVSLHPLVDLPNALGRFAQGEVATVHQIFAGAVSGDGLLLLNQHSALLLFDLLTGSDTPIKRLSKSHREVLSEVGNILLNACLGVFGDLLKVRLSFMVPRLHLDVLESFLKSLIIEKDELQCALVIGANFQLRSSEVQGCLVIVLGVSSFDQLMRAVERWALQSIQPGRHNGEA